MCNTALKCAIIQDGRKGYQIAQLLGWHPSKVSQIIIGAHTPNSEEKRQLADTLGKREIELFPVENEEPVRG